MTINLTPDEFRSLLKLAFLGNWMANAYREEPLPEFDNIEQVIMSRASSFGADDIAGHDPRKNTWVYAREFEETMQDFIDEYNVGALYDELGYWLARRDLLSEIGEEKAEEMTAAELSSAQQPYLDRYDLEFDLHGIERIGIIEDLPVKGGRKS